MRGDDPHFHIAGYDLGINGVRSVQNDADGTTDVLARTDGGNYVLASVPWREDDPKRKLGAVVTHLLMRYAAAVDFKMGRRNGMMNNPADPLDVTADEVSNYGRWKEEVAIARDAAASWDTYATLLDALAVPGLPSVSPFDPDYAAHTKYDFERRPPAAARKVDAHHVQELVNTASANAAAYRRYADRVEAYIKREWDYLEFPDAFPANEAEVQL